MTKKIIASILLFSSLSFASSIEGEEHINSWAGKYKVTKCIKCPDHIVDSGANMKNIKFFTFDYSVLTPDNLLGSMLLEPRKIT